MKFPAKGDSGSSKDFIRLKDGESVEGVFMGDPIDFKNHFKMGNCTGPGCKICATPGAPKAGFKFRINFIVKENGALLAKIFEQGWTVYESLAALNDEYEKSGADISRQKFRITRKGTGPEGTAYHVVAIPNGLLNDEIAGIIKKVQLKDLNEGLGAKQESVLGDDDFPFPGEGDATSNF